MKQGERRTVGAAAHVQVLSAERGVFDFRIVPDFSRNYLATYYCQPPTTDEQTVLSFLARQFPRIEGRPCAIEIGCGPTVHHILPLAPYVSDIHMADYLPENLEQVTLWRDGAPTAHRWHHYTSLALRLEGKPCDDMAIAERERTVRRQVTEMLRCDLKSDMPLGTPREYPVVGCFYVAENIGITKDEWFRVMSRVAGLVRSGGYLFMSALRETSFYVVKHANGELQRYPSAYLSDRDFEDILPQLGFSSAYTVVESRNVHGQESEGVNGVILVAAQKK